MILHDLRNTSSYLAKELLLARANDTDKEMFKWAYDPDLMYHVRFSTINWDTVKDFTTEDMTLLNTLTKRTITGNAAHKLVVEHCIKNGDLVKLICNKDLDCGVTAITLNNIFGKGFVPKFEVQLATEVPIKNIKQFPILGQIKYNGVRVIAQITHDKVVLKTRNGKTFEYPKLVELLSKAMLKVVSGIVLDGELTVGDSKGTDHTSVSGIVNSAIKGTPIKQDLVFTVFDTMSIGSFQKQDCPAPYSERFEWVKDIVTYLWSWEKNAQLVQIASTVELNSGTQIQEYFASVLALGYEGLILKYANHKYTFKRSKDWIKVKAVEHADLVCIGIEPGEGKYEGMIGALVCKGEVQGKTVQVNVGSGLTDADRSCDPHDYIGHCIEIKYNTVIQDTRTGNWSLFLPRFVTIRGDK